MSLFTGNTSSSISTASVEHSPRPAITRLSSKFKKSALQSSKKSKPSYKCNAALIGGRYSRAVKACEHCRMKKVKCDGISPCKRCIGGGMICRVRIGKPEFKKFPRGYTEVLEDTQYVLIPTLQKLYNMLRNNESWDLGEPRLNDRGLPVIHDIASKLGCIGPFCAGEPYYIPVDASDFPQIQTQLQVARRDLASNYTGSRKLSRTDWIESPKDRAERRTGGEKPSSSINMLSTHAQAQSQRQQQGSNQRISCDSDHSYINPLFISKVSLCPPLCTDLASECPFSSGSVDDIFSGPTHLPDLTMYNLSQQEFQISRSSPIHSDVRAGLDADILDMAFGNSRGTMKTDLLDYNTRARIQIDDTMFGDNKL